MKLRFDEVYKLEILIKLHHLVFEWLITAKLPVVLTYQLSNIAKSNTI